MAKQHEIEYPVRIGEAALAGAARKPFSEPGCGRHLVRIGTLMTLLPPAPARVLDLGCGTGWTSLFFARAGYAVVGVDIAPEMVRMADGLRAADGLANLTFVASDYEQLNFRDEFDAVVFFDSLHHAEDEGLAVAKAFAALKPGGVFLAEEPGAGHASAAETQAAVAQYGVTEKDMPPARVIELGRAAGFTGFRVFPHPDELAAEVYSKRAGVVADPFAETDPAQAAAEAPSLARRLAWLVRRVLRGRQPPPPWHLPGVEHLILGVRSNGLVLMRKGEVGPPPGR
ncbi:MAG: class I SAM-dependent methyltransferase [Gemmataceae bacterium]|nr:class I SAM-dependent methyltransferase [Gemmataceae bacterium]